MQGTISFDGLGTGINTTETVDKLIEVESRPKVLKEAEQVRLETQLEAWREIGSKLELLRENARTLFKASTWSTLRGVSSDESVLTATGGSGAVSGTYTFSVEQLAQAHQLASRRFSSSLDTVSEGTLKIQTGGKSTEITVDSSNNTLSGLAAAINDADAGVIASVIQAGNEFMLFISAEKQGTDNSVTLTGVVGDDLSAATIQAAQDAMLKFGAGVDAITIEASTNQVSNVVPGVTINLVSANPGRPVTLRLERDVEGPKEELNGFVENFNDAMAYLNELTDFNTETFERGVLQSDNQARFLKDNLRNFIISAVNTGGDYRTMRSIGITTNDDGTISFNEERFDAAAQRDYASVEALFQTRGYADNQKVSFVYAGIKALEPPLGGWQVEITSPAAKAMLEATNPANLSGGLLNIDSTNDELTIGINGNAPYTVVLDSGVYTIDELVEELQSKINLNNPGPGAVQVTRDEDLLTIGSTGWGDDSRIELVGGDALANLGFYAGASATGSTLRGTINGEPAYGVGQTLIGNNGNATSAGIQLSVGLTGDDLAGGPVSFKLHYDKGVAARFNEYLQRFTAPISGSLDLKEESLSNQIQDVADRITEMEERLEIRRQNLMAAFLRMESAVAELNGQGDFLFNQLQSLTRQ